MPSPPTLFDDEGDDLRREPDHDHESGARSGSVEARPRDDVDRPPTQPRGPAPARHPNYVFRRVVAIGGVVAVFAAGGLLVANLIGTGADTPTDGSASAEWNRILTVDERTGVLITTDDEGEQVGRRDTGLRDVTDLGVVAATAVAGADGAATVIDLTASDEGDDPEPVTVGADGITRPSGSALTMLAPARAAGRGLIVHGPSGDQLDTDAFAPVAGARYEFGTARSDPAGRHVLVTDSGNFQSVLFSFERDEPSYFPGLALAVDDRSVVTAQNVGDDATVSVFDHAGEPLGSARTPSVRAALLAGDTVHLVTVAGRIVDLDIVTGDTDGGAELGIGTITEGHVGTTGDRLIVVGSEGTAIVDDDGGVVGTYEGLLPRETATPAAPLGTRCLSLGGSDDDPAEGELAVVDTTTGAVVAEARAVGTVHPSADGCTVVVPTAGGVDVLDADGVRRVDSAGTLVTVTPDAAGLVVERDGRLVLIPVPGTDDPDTDTDTGTGTDTDGADNDTTDDAGVDLGPSGRLVAFTQL